MKKLLSIAFSGLLALSLVGCGGSSSNENTLVVSATLDPHSKILEEAKPILKSEYDIDLEIKVLDDYTIFNKALNSGEVDANYFQHRPYFEDEVSTYNYDIVEAGAIHLEPFGIYSKNIADVNAIPEGAEVIISNSITDNGRILAILANAGLITIKEGVDTISATINDIDSNPKNLKFTEIKPELLGTSFNNGEGDLVAINGNYALQAGLNPSKDALIIEEGNVNNPYVNIVACKKGDENTDKIKALVEVLKSDTIKNFISDTYEGSVIPVE